MMLAAGAMAAGCGQGKGAADPGPEAGPPPVPDSLAGEPMGSRGVRLGWRDRSHGTAWFSVERRESGATGWEKVGMRPPGEHSWEEWGLRPDEFYSYRVRALGTDGRESAPTNAMEIRTLPSEMPDPRVTVWDRRSVSPGVTLFNVIDVDQVETLAEIMAVDEEGNVIWQVEIPTFLVTETDLFPDGDILVQSGFMTFRLDRSGRVRSGSTEVHVRHDVDVLPWGNLIAITSPGLGSSADLATLFGHQNPWKTEIEWIVEFDLDTDEVMNVIRMEDIVPRQDTCETCFGRWLLTGSDWLHMNSLDYDPGDEALYVSVRNLNRIYKLGYPDGEVEWVMGDGGDFGQGLFSHQHNPTRIGDDRMLLFDNGLHRGFAEPVTSRVIEIQFDAGAGDARIVWEYDGPPSFYSDAMGDASRLPNGNTLVVDSMNGRIIEVTAEGLPVWELEFPPSFMTYRIYKAHRTLNFP